MIIVFSERGKLSLGGALNVAEHHFDEVNENFDYCVQRERAKEILTLRAQGIPYVVLSSIGNILERDSPSPILDTNVDFNRLPDHFTVVLRNDDPVHLPTALKLQPQLLNLTHRRSVEHWPTFIKEPDRFLKRAIHLIDHTELSERLLAGEIPTPIFIKGIEKGTQALSLRHVFKSQDDLNETFTLVKDALAKFPHLARANLKGLKENLHVLMKVGEPWYCELRDSMEPGRLSFFVPQAGVMLSDVLEIEKGPKAKQEFRAFIVNGAVTSLSAYVDYESIPVPNEIKAIAEDFARVNAEIAPAFVADFALTDRGPVLIEMNDFYRSGRYLDNDPVALYTALTKEIDLTAFTFVDPMPVPEDSDLRQDRDTGFGLMLTLDQGPEEQHFEPSEPKGFSFSPEP